MYLALDEGQMVFLVFYIQRMCHDHLITICSTEANAHDLGTSYVDKVVAGWYKDWEEKYNKDPIYSPSNLPTYEVVPCQLDQRSLDILITRD